MSSNFLPFLYHTRTLQRACRVPVSFVVAQKAGFVDRTPHTPRRYAQEQSTTRGRPSGRDLGDGPVIRPDNSIPFQWDDAESKETYEDSTSDPSATITKAEAKIFKGIFDEIAHNRMPTSNVKRKLSHSKFAASEEAQGTAETPESGSIVDQARGTQSQGEFLQRFPDSLREAAEVALGKFSLTADRPMMRGMMDLDEAERQKHKHWARFERIRIEERKRVKALMSECETDVGLWNVMEKEVFSLPEKLGILQAPKPRKPGKRLAKKLAAQAQAQAQKQAENGSEPEKESPKLSMDVHGPLYSQFLVEGLELLDSAFHEPSPFVFNVLPRIKELGLPSYVLGVSAPFLSTLARIHWRRFGDPVSVFDILKEMEESGLSADEASNTLLRAISNDLHKCTWGAQGPFVMSMMEVAPYDPSIQHRMTQARDFVYRSLNARESVEYLEENEDSSEEIGGGPIPVR